MKIQVKGRHVVVTDPLREYAEEKLSKLHLYLNERHIDEVTRVELELTVEKSRNSDDRQVAEATIFTRGPVMRAKESSPDMYASIDMVTEKLQRRAKKYHDKIQHKALRHHAKAAPTMAEPAAEGAEQADEPIPAPLAIAGLHDEAGGNGDNHGERFDEPRVVKSKQFALKPMSVEEAALQLELIGHDFFVFTNAETSDTNVVYRRNDGHYGLIEPARQ
ncbi:MAG TPA: ribosome-associated translation inhibitor RaiA [Thermoleophilia bacterium]|nr:ribosome-associated translation inhibitor RaiA [Thermoleophilia bacterium]